MVKFSLSDKNNVVLCACSIFYLIYVGLLTNLAPWAQDDYCLTLKGWDWHNGRYAGLLDLFYSIKNSYYFFNARVGQYLAGVIGYFGLKSFLVVNPFVHLCMAYSVFVLVIGRLPGLARTDALLLLISLFSTYLLVARPAQTVFWMAGALNYSWSFLILLLFLVPYRLVAEGSNIFPRKALGALVMLLMGLLAGATNEGTISVIIVFLGAGLLYYRSRQKLPVWTYLGFAALIAGFIYLMTAPAITVRLHTFPGYEAYARLTLLDKLSPGRIFRYMGDVLYTLAPLFVVIGLALAGLGTSFKSATDQPEGKAAIVFLLVGVAMVGILLLTPVSEAINTKVFSRALYGASIAMICGLLSMIKLLIRIRQRAACLLASIVVPMALVFSIILIKPYATAYALERQDFSLLAEAREKHVQGAVKVPTYWHSGWLDYAYSPTIMLAEDPAYWFNQCFVKSLGFPNGVSGVGSGSVW